MGFCHDIPIDQMRAGDFVQIKINGHIRRAMVVEIVGPIIRVETRAHKKLMPAMKSEIQKVWGDR